MEGRQASRRSKLACLGERGERAFSTTRTIIILALARDHGWTKLHTIEQKMVGSKDLMTQQRWADDATKNRVWIFQRRPHAPPGRQEAFTCLAAVVHLP